ncbi:PKD domain-containing protein [Bacteroidota bacterium]
MFPSPEPDFSINDSQQCFNGNQFAFTNLSSINTGTQSYLWDLGNGSSSLVTNPVYSYSSDDTFSVKLLNTSDLGCLDSLVRTVYIFPNPVADFAINDSQQCFNENAFVFSNLSAINTGNMAYAWSFGDGNGSVALSPSHVYGWDDTFSVRLVVSSNLSCADSAFLTSYVFPSPEPDFSINDSMQCYNENQFNFTNSSTIASGGMSYQWTFGDGDSTSGLHANHVYISDDTFRVTLVVISGLGCTDTSLKSTYVFPSPVSSFEVNDSIQCLKGNSFVFTNYSTIHTGTQNYVWQFGDGNSSTTTNASHQYASDDTFHVQLIANSDLGCNDTFIKEVFVWPTPVVAFSINDSTQCLRDNQFVFNNNTTISHGSMFYAWSLGDSDSSFLNNPTHTYLYDDTFRVELVAVSDLNCSDSILHNTYVHPMPNASFSVNDSAQCFNGNNFVFSNSSNIKWGNLNYTWYFGDGNNSLFTNPLHTYNSDDTFAITMVSTSNMGCRDSSYTTAIVYPSPVSTFTINQQSQCLTENSYSFNNTSMINSGNMNHSWYFGDGDSMISLHASHQYKTSDTFPVFLISTSTLDCSDSTSSWVFVRPMPVADFTVNDSQQCRNGNIFQFSNTSTIQYGTLSYQWRYGDGNSSTLLNPSHSYLNENKYQVRMIAKSNFNCPDTAYQTVDVFPSPKVDFSINDSTQCLRWNKFGFLNNTTISSGNINYTWTFGDGSSSTTIDPVYSYSNYSTFTVKLVGISNLSCPDSISKQVIVHPMPNADFSINDSTQCLVGNQFIFTNSTSIPFGTLSYFWNFGDTNTSTLKDPIHPYDTQGNYTIELVAISNSGCLDTLLKSVDVYPMPVPDFTYTTPCLDDTIYFTDQSIIEVPFSLVDWDWDFGNGNNSIQQNPWSTYSTPGTYNTRMTVTSDQGCQSTISKPLTFFDKVDPTIIDYATVENNKDIYIQWSPVMVGKPITFELERSTSYGGFQNLVNLAPDILEYTDQSVFVDRYSYLYRLRVIDDCNYISPYSNIGKSILLKASEEDEYPFLNWTAYEKWSIGVNRYLVELLDEEMGFFKPVITTNDTFFRDELTNENYTQYCYRITAFRNGDDIQSISNIVCIPTPFNVWVPNAFTPNGDEINPTFKVKGSFILEFEIFIYNRWGEKIYYSRDMKEGWDGKFKGELLPEGQYYYTISAKGTKGQLKTMSGTVLLLR